jgi:nitrogen fixation NifU-like protein
MESLDNLYSEVLLDHAKNPHRKNGEFEGFTHQMQLENTLCGDVVSIWLKADATNGTVIDASFDGKGCFVSQAAASLLVDHVVGKHVSQVEKDLIEFRKLLIEECEGDKTENPELGDLVTLGGIKKFPIRIKCALLAFETLQKALKKNV